MRPLKLAHRDGHTDVCYDSSGSFILTGGTDGKVCIWEGLDDSDTTTVSVGETVHALAFQGGRFFAATDDNALRIYTFPDGMADGMVTRFNGCVRHIDISADGETLVAGADDFKVKVMNMSDNECAVTFGGHEAPILSVALDPTQEFVASSSCDGTVKVWSVADGAVEKSWSILKKCNEPSQAESQCRMSWSEDGEHLFIPVEKEVQIYSRSSWEMIATMTSPDIKDTINVIAMSPDWSSLAVGTTNGFIGVFNVSTKSLTERSNMKLEITALAWNPTDNGELAFCDNMGQLGFMDLHAGKDKAANSDDDMMDDMVSSSAGVNAPDDPDDDNSIDIGSIKRKWEPLMKEDDDAESTTSSRAPLEPPIPPSAPVLPANIFKPTPLQPPFQSGSTPEHLSSRFMIWNSVGIVRQYTSEDENSIDIEFHDTATHHSLHVDNHCDYTMAALSSQAVVLASRGDHDSSSKMLVMHFGSWDSHKEWSYDMPAGEEIQSVAATENLVAIATASRTLRVFSVGGIQREVMCLPGKPVALAAHQRTLMVVYHKGMGVPGDQHMGVTVLRLGKTSKTCILRDETLPLSPASRLAWLGFSTEGTPFTMDYDGVVRMLSRKCGSTWWPVAHTKQHTKGKSDHYWLVSISEKQQHIRCIPCKGSRYPATLPRPALAVLSLQLPFLDMDMEKSQIEESYQRHNLIAENLRASCDEGEAEEMMRPIREALVKLFAFSAKAERDFRAIEVCDMMPDHKLLHIAATYATRLKRIQLAERVSGVMHRRQEEEEEEEEEEEDQVEEEEEEEERLHPESEDDMEATQHVDDDAPDTPTTPFTPTPGPMLRLKSMDNEGKLTKSASQTKKNPFMMATSAERSNRGSQVFDKMEKSTPKSAPAFAPLPISIKKSGKKVTSGQAKLGFKKDEGPAGSAKKSVKKEPLLSQYSREDEGGRENEPIKKKMSAFDLWLDSNKASLQEEHPDLGEEDLGQAATEAFRGLTKEDRQVWVAKAKALAGGGDSKKRKASTDGTDKAGAEETPAALKKMKSEDISTDKKTPLSQSTNAKLARFAKVD